MTHISLDEYLDLIYQEKKWNNYDSWNFILSDKEKYVQKLIMHNQGGMPFKIMTPDNYSDLPKFADNHEKMIEL